jgi:FkbM family methyltransferase
VRAVLLNEKDHFSFLGIWDLDSWREYYMKNSSSVLEQRLNALKSGLDDKSKVVVDLLHDRRYSLPIPRRCRELIFIRQDKHVFAPWELEQQKQQSAFMKEYLKTVPDRYTNPRLYEWSFLLATDTGLIYLSQKQYDYIKGKDFIDGGAFYGDSALVLSKYSPSKIYSFEPIDENFKGLQYTIETKPELKNICVPVKKGIGEDYETVEFLVNDTSSSMYYELDGASKQVVDIIKLDDFIAENNLNFGLLKLDVEGSEFGTIKGCLNSIKKFRPVLLISIYHRPEDFYEIKPLLEKEVGNYKFKVRKLNPSDSSVVDVMLIGYPAELD